MADAKQDCTSSSNQSKIILAKPRLGGFSSTGVGAASSSKSNNNPFGSVLRPPQLKPSSNPFLKVTNEAESLKDEKKKATEGTSARLHDDSSDKDPVKFVPLGTSSSAPRPSNPVPAPVQSTSTGSSQFIFGQNLSERVIVNENAGLNGEASNEHKATNGTELLFTSAAATVKENHQNDAGTSDSVSSSSGEGLAAAAAEYERAHAKPPPPTSYHLTTGEEDEINVLQISCRLFAWEGGSWRERGRGVLRLNDAAEGGGSRVVARVAGSLRVLLNTKLWPGMVVQSAGTKSLRITAADAHQQIKLFLIMGAPGDISNLHRALLPRVAASKQTENKHNTSQEAAERLDQYQQNQPVDDPTFEEFDDNNECASDKSDHNELPADKTDSNELPADKTDSNELTAHKSDNNEIAAVKQDSKDKQDNINEGKEEKSLKRKEPVEDETSPKRQCPKIVIEQ